MGYTRYWKRTNFKIPSAFLDEVVDIFEECRLKGIILRNGLGEDTPEISKDGVIFNGDAKNPYTDLSHETFCITNNPNEEGFNFCKTARKPYDYAVRKVLALAVKYKLVKDVSSDGPNRTVLSDMDYITKDCGVGSLANKVFELLNRYLCRYPKPEEVLVDLNVLTSTNNYKGLTKEIIKSIVDDAKSGGDATIYLRQFPIVNQWLTYRTDSHKHLFKNVK